MALTEIPLELSSTPSIVDNGNATAITIGSDESATFAGPVKLTAGALAAAGNAGLSHRSADNKVYLQAGTGGFNILDDQQNTHFSIDSAGVTTVANGLTLTDGNVVVAAGHGIDFSANANAAGASSELLDDYETGTWNPTLAGYYGTYGMSISQGTRSGKYTKVGNLVTLSMEIHNAGVAASGNGDIIVITGLPFAIGSSCVGSHAHTSIASLAGGGWTSINFTQLGHLGNNGTSSNAWTWLTGANVATAGVAIRLTITYRH